MSLSSTSCAFQRPSNIVGFVSKIYNGFSNRIVVIKMSLACATPGERILNTPRWNLQQKESILWKFWYGYHISPVAFGPNLDRVWS